MLLVGNLKDLLSLLTDLICQSIVDVAGAVRARGV
jgi:hypothetical protein